MQAATPRIDQFLEEPSRAHGKQLALAINRLEKRSMPERPNFQPNDAALELLRESLIQQREIRADVSGIKEDLAEIRGMDLKSRFEKVDQIHDKLAADISTVKTEIEVIKTAAAPGKFLMAEGIKASIMAVLAGVAGWIAGHWGQVPPHH